MKPKLFTTTLVFVAIFGVPNTKAFFDIEAQPTQKVFAVGDPVILDVSLSNHQIVAEKINLGPTFDLEGTWIDRFTITVIHNGISIERTPTIYSAMSEHILAPAALELGPGESKRISIILSEEYHISDLGNYSVNIGFGATDRNSQTQTSFAVNSGDSVTLESRYKAIWTECQKSSSDGERHNYLEKIICLSQNPNAITVQEDLFSKRKEMAVKALEMGNLIHTLIETHDFNIINSMIKDISSVKDYHHTKLTVYREILNEGISTFDEKTQEVLNPFIEQMRSETHSK